MANGYDDELEGALNPNHHECHKILLRKYIKCYYIIKGTPTCAPTRWPGSDTRWLGLPGQGAGVQEVRGSKPGGTATLLRTLFRVR